MVRKPKLSQALASYTKKQAVKAKDKKRQDSIDLITKNKVRKSSGSGGGPVTNDTESKVQVKSKSDDHVPCHIWTDADKMQKRTKIPFHPNNNSVVLLIGEGDFSYCRAMVTAFLAGEKVLLESDEDHKRSWRVVATALDSRETALRKYRKSSANLAFLEDIENVEIIFGIDGTKLHEDRELKRLFPSSAVAPTRVIFNFPHTGAGLKDRTRNIVAQQKMLQGFFASVIKFMQTRDKSDDRCTYTTTMIKKDYSIKDEVSSQKQKRKFPTTKSSKKIKKESDDEEESENEDEYVIDDAELLANNAKILKEDKEIGLFDENSRGESFEIHCTIKTGDPYDSWKPKTLATRTGHLTCLQTFKFCPELYPGYQHCRTIGDGKDEVVEADGWKEFLAGKPAKTFVFSFTTTNKK